MSPDRENKLDGEIINIVREEREWRKMGYWPKEFVRKDGYGDSEEEEGDSEDGKGDGRRNPNRRVGEMPPSDEEEEEE